MITATTDQDVPDARTAALAPDGGRRSYEPHNYLGETVTMIGDAVQVVGARRATGRRA